jgi:hypothetical protein
MNYSANNIDNIQINDDIMKNKNLSEIWVQLAKSALMDEEYHHIHALKTLTRHCFVTI